QNDLGGMSALWRWTDRSALMTSLLSVSIGLVLALNLDGVLRLSLMVGLIMIPLVAISDIRGAALRGLHHVVLGQLPELLLRPLFLLVFALAIFWGWPSLGTPAGLMAAHVVAAGVALCIAILMLRGARPIASIANHASSNSRLWLRSAFPLGIIGSVKILNAQSGVLIVGWYEPIDQVGYYKLAVQVAAIIALPIDAINL